MPHLNCPVYDWCDADHTESGMRDDLHEQNFTIRVGDTEQEFMLSLDGGRPRIDTMTGNAEMWIEPGEHTNTFHNIAKVWLLASERYDQFVREQTPTLRRHTSVTERLVEAEG